MEITLVQLRKMFILSEKQVMALGKLASRATALPVLSRPTMAFQLSTSCAVGLAKHQCVRLSKDKNGKILKARITAKGSRLLRTWEAMKKADKIEVRFKPCDACRRTDGTHKMMCPVGLGIMKAD